MEVDQYNIFRMKRDQLSAAVVKSGLITDEFIILCAQHAFMESGHVKENTYLIDVGWATADTAFETVQGAIAHQATLFQRFQDCYNGRLKKSFVNGDSGNEHQAHHVSEIETRMKYMKEKLELLKITLRQSTVLASERIQAHVCRRRSRWATALPLVPRRSVRW